MLTYRHDGEKGIDMYRVIVDISPKTIPGTNGCHEYVFGEYKTRREAFRVSEEINRTKDAGTAVVEKKAEG